MCKVHVFLKFVACELDSRQHRGTSYSNFCTFSILAFSILMWINNKFDLKNKCSFANFYAQIFHFTKLINRFQLRRNAWFSWKFKYNLWNRFAFKRNTISDAVNLKNVDMHWCNQTRVMDVLLSHWNQVTYNLKIY